MVAKDLKLPDNTGAKGVVTLKKRFPDAFLVVLPGFGEWQTTEPQQADKHAVWL